MSAIFKEIEYQNKINYDSNWFWDIIKFQKKELFKKIIIANTGKRYDFSFEWNEKYFSDISKFIETEIFKKDILTIDNYKKLYKLIFSSFHESKNLWFRKVNITADVWWNIWKDTYSNYNDIIKELEVIFSSYNNKNIPLFEKLYIITIKILSKTHPFPNNNFLFISVFLDILLVKNKFLPIWIKKTFKDNNLFLPNENIFYKIILLRYKEYSY